MVWFIFGIKRHTKRHSALYYSNLIMVIDNYAQM